MEVTLVGLGCGTAATMTVEGREAVAQADCLLGAARVLDALPADCTDNRRTATRAEAVLEGLLTAGAERPCVVYSGDSGFYSGTKSLLPLLQRQGLTYRILPGISSVQVLSAQLGRPWQDWALHSAHGTDCDVVSAVSQGRPAFFLTGGALTAEIICRNLTAAGLGELPVTVGENLSYDGQRIVCDSAEALAQQTFAPLSVLLAEPAPRRDARSPGYPDEDFLRGAVPMTKQEVRAAVLSKLAVRPVDTVWDVGAGTGSVSVELALVAHRGRVYAVECAEVACGLILENKKRFGAWNLTLISGKAPEALQDLPAPDAVFLGGTKGRLADIVDAALAKNPAARLCVSAIAVETLGAAVAALTARGLEVEVTQIAVSRSRPAGGLHLLTANNPVFLICGQKREETP